MSPVIEERLEKILGLSLKRGSHLPNSNFCVMEAVAYVAGEPWSDHPECACPVISAFLRSWNDSLASDDERDRLLKSLVPRLVGTRNKKLEKKRSLMAADWMIRVHTPAWLRLAGLTAQAERLEALPEITAMKHYPSLRGLLGAIRDDAHKARDAAGAATGAAAWAAMWDTVRAAAGDAMGATAWNAARAAAGDAAWAAAGAAALAAALAAAGAAAWNAASAAAWAAKLKPTVDKLQTSALELVNRMIEAK